MLKKTLDRGMGKCAPFLTFVMGERMGAKIHN